MKVSLNWLKEFVEIPADPRRLKTDLTRVGLNVESFRQADDDWVLEIEVTTNRPDCLSHFGMAREAATLYGKPLKCREIKVQESGGPASSEISIEILDPDLCARYCGRGIRHLQVKPSPDWMQKRLESVGVRPINNVADVTNYVLMELGHPLHAFDLARLRQKKIIVRRAKPGEHLRTLDGLDRALGLENLVIADGERPVALAGIMGGEESGITGSTRAVLLESAWFDPLSIRRAAKSHGIHTEASHRFERGADIEMAPQALDRAATLIAELAGGQILRGVVDVYPGLHPRKAVALHPSQIRRVLGADLPREEIERVLGSLGFMMEPGEGGAWRVTPPSFRLDVTREVDLIEEIARHYGYDRLPSRLRPASPRLERDRVREKELTASAILVALGYREIIPPSMVDPDENARFTDRPPVLLANPLSQEASALRSTPVPSMVWALRRNLDREQNDLRFFEIGKTYAARPKGLPEERRVLTLGLSGHRRPQTVHHQAKPLDFFDIKGDLEALLEAFETPGLEFEPGGCNYYQPALSGRFAAGDKAVALFGQLRREFADEYKLRQPVWLAEVDFERLLEFPLRSRVFHPYSKFPAVERDFSLVVPKGVPYNRIEAALRRLALPEILDFHPVDLFRGGSLEAGHYSLLLRVTFQRQTHTLIGEEIAEASQKLLAALQPLGVRVRG